MIKDNKIIKKILLVGENSYIGNSFFDCFKNDYLIKTIDAKKELNVDNFKGFDVVIHLAAIVHKKESIFNKKLYFKVNTDLAVTSCKLSKEANVKQFIFMSTMAIYGKDLRIGKTHVIDVNTLPTPKSYYGKSKLLAEKEILKLKDDNFKVLIIRSPMVYGKGCKGNYVKLLKIAKLLPFVPNIDNKRSTISISNLNNFIKLGIDNNFDGIYFPQDTQYANTKEIMINHKLLLGKKIRLTKIFNPLIYFLGLFNKSLRKAFGSKIYEIGKINSQIGVKY